MKKILFGLIAFLFPLMFINATSISDIDMDIYVDKNGDAFITETWNAYVNEGTEGYHPYFNIGTSTITDLEVSMDGKNFTTIDNWDINNSFSEKSNKAGIYYTGNEIDLCFGITNYGRHVYTIKYKINGFVSRTTDADMIYWTLFPYNFSASPDNVHVKIYSDTKYSDNLDVWGYGNYGGTAYVYDGYIEINSEGKLSSSEYMTILVKFPKNTFNTTNITTNNFNYYYELAEKGATHYEDNDNEISPIISIIILLIGSVILFIIASLSIKERYKYGSKGSTVKKDVPFFRDIPCKKDLFRAYFIANKYGLIEKKEDFLGSILLKWLKDGNVQTETIEKKVLFKTKEISNIIFVNKNNLISLEQNLYDWMFEASQDGKLESKEFEKWCKKNYQKILKWFDDVIKYERDVLISEGTIVKENKKVLKLFKIINYNLPDSLMEEAEQLKGLRLYLKEFTVIDQRQPIEVKLWNEYLIFAQIFGIADKVAKQFEKLYPEITEEINRYGYNYNTIYFMNSVSERSSKSIERAQSYSSGGGGFSSGGGGGGSFGGGGGGGGFR
ncbi:MAG: DUF2207 domain-containing protein [Firmicutes bacterium]|nr:DUF2207 domain-containing protein [Bacillota bacterium]